MTTSTLFPLSFETPTFFPLTFHSHTLSFSDWISLITLALAPLIAHLLAGAPQPSYLVRSRPKWHDYLVHYNPTSIFWRYAAIADRRIRALDWSRQDMAATNALFWTAHGWDGSQEMVELSVLYRLRVPEHSRVSLFSLDTVKTVVLALQGLQTLYVLVGTFFGVHDFSANLAADTTFGPLAILGFLRLVAAPWLTSDYMFTFRHTLLPDDTDDDPLDKKTSFDSLLEANNNAIATQQSGRFRLPSFLPSRIFRVGYTIALLGVCVIVILLSSPICWSGYPCKNGFVYAASTLLQIAFYLVAITTSFVVCVYYFIRERTAVMSTVIPCISATWYKVHSFALAVMACMLLILSIAETRKTPCGKYSKLPTDVGDVASCNPSENLQVRGFEKVSDKRCRSQESLERGVWGLI
ncbi:hypothetical protein F5B22DRAFT_639818 [Xylaria bambusicola]|uniref:uncharacterized protein n=1 Tax=Xylaria bambusicola TaxID=326684 RepID=UPI00200886D8|nr:uncharacterized protein F5B22DRAFT_639818 [Xylaria bambusicola]KAI0505650.1 hypothetical protein F5B22DRAFT_639818 [Xylaria bambusicola]